MCATEGDIRLVNGSNKFEGRVEYCNGSAWGRLCNIGFSTQEIMVACRQIGFSGNFDRKLNNSNQVLSGKRGLIVQLFLNRIRLYLVWAVVF